MAVKVGVAALHAVFHKGQLCGGKLPAIAFFVFVEAQTFAQTQLQDEIILRTAAAVHDGRGLVPQKGFGDSVLYCGIGLVVFMLLTAYDTQKLRHIYAYYAGDAELAEKASIYGALTLYLDFINIFLYVVRLLGMNSRSRNN